MLVGCGTKTANETTNEITKDTIHEITNEAINDESAQVQPPTAIGLIQEISQSYNERSEEVSRLYQSFRNNAPQADENNPALKSAVMKDESDVQEII